LVDANVSSGVFGEDPDFSPVRDVLFLGKPKPWSLAHGGKLTDELRAVDRVRRALVTLEQAGRTKQVPGADVEAETQRLLQTGLCQSNDVHVIAVARRSDARLLCSHDQALIEDFGNPALVNNPRGKVYKNKGHARLLRGDW